uniref:Threonine dehydratase n=1 Tax=Tetraselmis sp. GSL018 TaxID=582737 RepID=A0A061SL66_9CHLO
MYLSCAALSSDKHCLTKESTSLPIRAEASRRRLVYFSLHFKVCRASATDETAPGTEQPEQEEKPAMPLVKPEDLRLEPGTLSYVDREGSNLPQDVYRCPGCAAAECQTDVGCSSNMWRFERGGYLRASLTARVYDVAEQTPLEVASKLSEALGNTIYLKREDLQPVKSFKLRGAYNKMANLTRDELARGVICSSAGNHAQGVALSAKQLGCSAVICMPTNTPKIKVDAVQRLGGTVELVGESYNETQAYAMDRAEADGRVFVAPYDDPFTIAGQGTIGTEIVQQVKHLDELDAVFVAVGGGGLIAGIAAVLKELKPSIKVIGVEPVGANAMAQSLATGRRVMLSKVDAFADGVAVKQVGMETFRLCRQLVDGIVLVDNSAISAAIKDVFNETRSILEPAGAVALAGAKAWIKRHGVKDHRIVAVTSGANINFDRLRLVSELADVGAKMEVMLASTIPERPGSFMDFVRVITEADSDLEFTEFKYRYSATSDAQILYSITMNSGFELHELMSRLEENGMPTTDCSGLNPALMHLRHMVGGRPRSFTGEIPDERMFTVAFPERRGTLLRFLQQYDGYNITMFHYRKSGNQKTELLLGMQVPSNREDEFNQFAEELSAVGYDFQALDDTSQTVFNMFLQ